MRQHRRPPPPDRDLVVEDIAAPVLPGRTHGTWFTVKRVRSIAYGCFVVAAAIALVIGYLGADFTRQVDEDQQRTEQRLAELEDYVADRRSERDAEQAERDGEIRDFLCRVLAQFPPGVPALDQARVTLACTEPGTIPAATSGPTPTPLPAPAPMSTPADDGPAPDRPPARPPPPSAPATTAPPAAAPSPAPAPSAPPADPGPLCGLLPLTCPLGL